MIFFFLHQGTEHKIFQVIKSSNNEKRVIYFEYIELD